MASGTVVTNTVNVVMNSSLHLAAAGPPSVMHAINDWRFQGFEAPKSKRYFTTMCLNKAYDIVLGSGTDLVDVFQPDGTHIRVPVSALVSDAGAHCA